MECELVRRCTSKRKHPCQNSGIGCGILMWWNAQPDGGPTGPLNMLVSGKTIKEKKSVPTISSYNW